MPKRNIGESDELRFKTYVANRDELFGMKIIQVDPVTHQPTREGEIKKSPAKFKSDATFKLGDSDFIWNASIKSLNGAKPAILNHTHAAAKCFSEGGHLEGAVPDITSVVQRYITSRKNGGAEDVSLKKFVTDVEMDSVVSMLAYFTFTGTGKGPSEVPANCIIYIKGGKVRMKKCHTVELQRKYVSRLLTKDKYILSLRSKGMPKPNKISDVHRKWIYVGNDDKLRGSIHIRVKTDSA